jgi:GDPmannose 4,6-dehydratase
VSSANRALILGISGQDGSYLAEFLLERGYDVWGVVRRPPDDARFPNLDHIRGELQLLQGDLLDHMALIEAFTRARPHELYNLAGTSFVPASWHQPVMTAQFTAVGATSMLEAIRVVDPSVRLYQASSSEIFGATDTAPQDERSALRAHTPYGAAKLYAHCMTGAYRDRYGLHASSGIAYNHESPRRPTEFVTRKVTRAAAAIKLGLESRLELGDLDARRDWGHSRDFVEAMWLMLQQDEADDYILATGVSRSVRDLVETAFACVELDPDEHVSVDPSLVRPPEPVPLVGDPAKARERLGWSPRTSFEDLIAEMVEHDLRLLDARASATPAH